MQFTVTNNVYKIDTPTFKVIGRVCLEKKTATGLQMSIWSCLTVSRLVKSVKCYAITCISADAEGRVDWPVLGKMLTAKLLGEVNACLTAACI